MREARPRGLWCHDVPQGCRLPSFGTDKAERAELGPTKAWERPTSPGGAHSSRLQPEVSVSGLALSSPYKPAGINQIPAPHKLNVTTANFGEEEEPGGCSLQPCRLLCANPHLVGGCRTHPLAGSIPEAAPKVPAENHKPSKSSLLALFPGIFSVLTPERGSVLLLMDALCLGSRH